MSGAREIRNLYADWQREETARREQSERLKALFATAKDMRLNAKALRVAFKERYALDHLSKDDIEKRNEDAGLVDEYLSVLSGPSRTHACEDRDPETGEITEPQVAPQPAQPSSVGAEIFPEPDGRSVGASPVTHSPETAERGAGPETAPASDGGAVSPAAPSSAHRSMSISPLEPREAGGLKGFGFTVSFGDPEETREQRTLRMRPGCQRPSACAGVGRDHCFTCWTAMQETPEPAA